MAYQVRVHVDVATEVRRAVDEQLSKAMDEASNGELLREEKREKAGKR